MNQGLVRRDRYSITTAERRLVITYVALHVSMATVLCTIHVVGFFAILFSNLLSIFEYEQHKIRESF